MKAVGLFALVWVGAAAWPALIRFAEWLSKAETPGIMPLVVVFALGGVFLAILPAGWFLVQIQRSIGNTLTALVGITMGILQASAMFVFTGCIDLLENQPFSSLFDERLSSLFQLGLQSSSGLLIGYVFLVLTFTPVVAATSKS